MLIHASWGKTLLLPLALVASLLAISVPDSIETVETSATIGLRTSSFAANAVSTTLAIPRPAGVTAGDVLLATVDVRGAPSVAAPSGWTMARQDRNRTAMSKATYYRVASASEPTSYRWSFSTAQAASGAVMAYTGVDTTSPVGEASGQANAPSTQITAPSVTTVTEYTMVVGLFGIARKAAVAPPTGMTEVGEVSSTGKPKVTSEVAAVVQASPGPSGVKVATADAAARNIGHLVALRPVAAASSPSPSLSPTSAPEPSPAGPPPIAFVFEPASGCTRPCAEQTAIRGQQADGSGTVPVTAPTDGYDRTPRWAPDGTKMAFTRTLWSSEDAELFVADVAGDGFAAPRRVTSTADAHGGAGCQSATMIPVWSPDSARLAFTCSAGPEAASAVYVVSAGGTRQFPVATDPMMADSSPTWSPDSARLAFTRRDTRRGFGEPGRVAICTADVDAAAARDLRILVSGSQSADHPQWSPTGEMVAFVETEQLTLRPSLRTVASDGTGARTVYAAPVDRPMVLYHVAWAPDGSRLAFPVGDGLRDSVVHTLEVATGAVGTVSRTGELAYAPQWSPDGNRVIFDAISADTTGTEVHRLVTASPDGAFHEALPVSGGYAYDAHWRH